MKRLYKIVMLVWHRKLNLVLAVGLLGADSGSVCGTVWSVTGLCYTMAHEKPARRLVDQRGRRSRTLYRKLNAKYLLVREGAENDLLVRQCIDIQGDHFQRLL